MPDWLEKLHLALSGFEEKVSKHNQKMQRNLAVIRVTSQLSGAISRERIFLEAALKSSVLSVDTEEMLEGAGPEFRSIFEGQWLQQMQRLEGEGLLAGDPATQATHYEEPCFVVSATAGDEIQLELAARIKDLRAQRHSVISEIRQQLSARRELWPEFRNHALNFGLGTLLKEFFADFGDTVPNNRPESALFGPVGI